MRYYIIESDLTTKIVGSDYPQSWQFTKEYKKRVDNPNTIYPLDEVLYKKRQRPDFIPDLDGFVLSGRAKLTSFVSVTTMYGLFMDDNARQILQSKCNLGDHEFYEATLYVRKEPVRFYYLGLFYDTTPLIAFNKCDYVVYGVDSVRDLPKEWITKPIEGYSDLCEIEDKHRQYPSVMRVGCEKIRVKKEFDFNVDIFMAGRFNFYRNGICSERFKNAVEEAGLTGIVFNPIEVEFEE